MKTVISALILLYAFLFSTAYAGAYLGVGAVQTDYNLSAPADDIFDDTTSGYLVAVGYEPAKFWLSPEIEYVHFGSDTRGNANLEAKAITLWAVAQTELFKIGGIPIKGGLRAGVTRGETDLAINDFVYSDSDTGWAAGAQLTAQLSNHFGIGVTYREYKFNFDPPGGGESVKIDPNVAAVYATLSF